MRNFKSKLNIEDPYACVVCSHLGLSIFVVERLFVKGFESTSELVKFQINFALFFLWWSRFDRLHLTYISSDHNPSNQLYLFVYFSKQRC